MNTRKIFTSLLVFIFVFSNAAVFAQMPVAVPGVGASFEGLSKIGVVAAIQGKVELMTPGAAGRVVQSGAEIFIGDEVKTDALGHLQILLLDETVFTIGPNSAITIDKFIYDPQTHVGKVEASITKGVFRYVSGKIAANKPENVSIKLPTATIGIRGTIVAGEASSTQSMAMLLGPGARNETGATIGSFVMSGTGENSGRQEHVNRTGFGVSADQTGTLSGVFQVPEAQLQHLTTALLPAQGQGPGAGGGGNDQGAPPAGRTPHQGPPPGAQPPAGSGPGTAPGMSPSGSGPAPMTTTGVFGAGANMGQISGAQTFAGFQMMQQVNMMGMLQNGLDQDSTKATQEGAHNSAIQNTSTRTVRDTLKSDMLAHVAASIVSYQHTGGNFTFNNLPGIITAVLNVDFSSDKLLASGSYVQVNVPGMSLVDKCGLTADQSFSSMSDPNFAKFELTGSALQQFGPTQYNIGSFNSVTIQFQDVIKQSADGTSPQVDIAGQAKVTVDYTSSPNTGSGVVIVPQQP